MKKTLAVISLLSMFLFLFFCRAYGTDNCKIPLASSISVITKPVMEITSPVNGKIMDTAIIGGAFASLRFQQERACTVAKQHTGGSVRPVHDAGKGFRTDDQYLVGLS